MNRCVFPNGNYDLDVIICGHFDISPHQVKLLGEDLRLKYEYLNAEHNYRISKDQELSGSKLRAYSNRDKGTTRKALVFRMT